MVKVFNRHKDGLTCLSELCRQPYVAVYELSLKLIILLLVMLVLFIFYYFSLHLNQSKINLSGHDIPSMLIEIEFSWLISY